MLSFEGMQCDCIDLFTEGARLVIGLSHLEGNVWDGCLKIIDCSTGQEICNAPCAASIATVAEADRDNIVAVGADDGTITLYSTQELSTVASFYAHDNIVSRVAYNTQSAQYLSSGWDGAMHLWDLTTIECKPLVTFSNAHNGLISDCCYNPHTPSAIASVGRDGFLRLWDLRDAKACVDILDLGNAASCVAFDLTDAHSLVAGTDSGAILALDTRKLSGFHSGAPQCLQHHQSRVRRIRSVPGVAGSWVSASDDTTIAAFSTTTTLGSPAQQPLYFLSHSDYVADVALAFSDAGYKIYSASTDCSVRCHDLKPGSD